MSALKQDVEIQEINGATRQIQPQVEIERKRKVVKKSKKYKKKGLYSLGSVLGISSVALFGFLFGQLYLDSQISRIHYQTQELRMQINRETTNNQHLSTKIAELSMYSRVVEIAQAHGLDYQDNIISIGQ